MAAFGAAGDDPLYAAVSEGARRAGLEHWLPLFYPQAGDPVRLSARRRPDRPRPSGRGGARRAAGDDRRRLRRARQRRAQGALPAAAALGALPLQHRVGPAPRRAPAAPVRRRSARTPRPAWSTWARKLGRNFAAERAQDSVNLFEAAADHARRLMADGKRVLFASWSEGASERLGRHAGRPRPQGRPVLALLAGGQGGRSEEAAAGGAAARHRLRDRQPGGHLRDRHPGRPAGAAAPAPPRHQLPGRGLRADARRPRRPHRPRHRPLRRA